MNKGGFASNNNRGQTTFFYAAKSGQHESWSVPDYPIILLSAGMQSNAEILLGTRTVAEYLLSPVRKVWHEAGRER